MNFEKSDSSFAGAYSDQAFWRKLLQQAKAGGREVMEKALWLYYAAQQPQTPRWAKASIYGALGYFIFPLDALADFLPGVGYVDDLGVLSAALVTVALYINDEVKALAAGKMTQWFGPEVL